MSYGDFNKKFDEDDWTSSSTRHNWRLVDKEGEFKDQDNLFNHLGPISTFGSDTLVFEQPNDNVNHPPHYTKGKVEAIDTIEDAIKDAPNATVGMLQGQVLKYLLRLWHKNNSKEDAKKALWYLNRLIDKL